MYAITDSSYRTVSSPTEVGQGEVYSDTIPPALIATLRIEEARQKRNQMLRSSDWTQVGDTSLPAANKALWVVYRQALRDLPQISGFPDIPWPGEPPLPAGAGVSG